jgi:hypothetical protein
MKGGDGSVSERGFERGSSPRTGYQTNAPMSPVDRIPLAQADGLLPGGELEGSTDSCGYSVEKLSERLLDAFFGSPLTLDRIVIVDPGSI